MRPAFALICASLLSACAGFVARDEASGSRIPDSLIILDQPPIIEARSEQDLTLVRLQATRLDPARLGARTDARTVGVEALPYLSNSEAGQKFLGLALPRAISRGSPPEICPAVGVAGGPGGGTAGDAAVAATGGCLAALGDAADVCGCRLLALDGIVTVPRSELSYATGTTARLSAPALGLDLVIVAEDLGGGLTLLRDLRGPVGLLRHLPDGRVDLAFENGDRFEGESRAIGFRRGRLAEQIGLADQDGRRLTLMIGLSPEELASGAGGPAAERPKG